MSQAAKASRIAAGYVEIKKLIENASYAKIIKVSNKIIHDDNHQAEAWQCKVVAMIQTDQFQETINTINKAPNAHGLQFEHAYCQYRLNNVPAALVAIDKAHDQDSLRVQELRAQIYYRLEQYNECYGVYRELVRTTADDLDMERTTNMAAVQVHRTALGECDVPEAPAAKAPYEQWYNSGCAAVMGGAFEQANIRLQKAMKQCAMLLQEEGAADEELQQEQAIIRVQRGFALQLAGREKEASAEYNAVLQHKVTDPALLAILHNNLATLNREAHVFDSRKKMKATMVPELEHKLTSLQRDQLALNNCLLSFYSQQPQQTDESIEKECQALLGRASSSLRLNAALLLAASLTRAGKTDQAVQTLHDWLGKNQNQHETTVRLTATQLRLMKNDVSGGITELLSLPISDRYRPGVVAAIVTLLKAKKQKQQIAQTFKDAANYYDKNKGALPSESVQKVLRHAADQHLLEGDPRGAAAVLEHLRAIVGDSCLPALISAYSQFDSAKAQVLSRQVSLPTDALSALDANALEASLGPKYLMKIAHKQEDKENVAAQTAEKAAGSGRVKPRKKRRRRTVLPKNYVVGFVPDPDRWLPRWQRRPTGGGRRRKDRKKEKEGVGKGTQGGVGDATDKYDITKNPGQGKSNTAHQTEPTGPRRNMPNKRNKNKKK